MGIFIYTGATERRDIDLHTGDGVVALQLVKGQLCEAPEDHPLIRQMIADGDLAPAEKPEKPAKAEKEPKG